MRNWHWLFFHHQKADRQSCIYVLIPNYSVTVNKYLATYFIFRKNWKIVWGNNSRLELGWYSCFILCLLLLLFWLPSAVQSLRFQRHQASSPLEKQNCCNSHYWEKWSVHSWKSWLGFSITEIIYKGNLASSSYCEEQRAEQGGFPTPTTAVAEVGGAHQVCSSFSPVPRAAAKAPKPTMAGTAQLQPGTPQNQWGSRKGIQRRLSCKRNLSYHGDPQWEGLAVCTVLVCTRRKLLIQLTSPV